MPDKPAPFSRPGWSEAERAARDSYGRLVAWLAYRWRDLAAAEDALSEALLAALTHWPDTGVPASPDAWLMAVAKRELLQRARHERVAQSPEVLALFDEEPAMPDPSAEPAALPDERLRLMFVCAHPSLPPAMHAPLMLQAVLGLDAKTIAQAFLIAPAAMAQRLVRAKAKIRDAGLRFEEPEARDLPQRLAAVLDSIYGAYTIGSDVASQAPEAAASPSIAGLTSEALYLAELTASLQSDSAEALALLALMRYCEARRPAQFDATGRFVPLTEQDTLRWDRALIHSAEGLLWQASQRRTPGPFQFEAAIQSAHCQRAFTGQTPWPGIAALYAALVAHFPSVGARLGQAVALAETGDVDGGLTVLDGIAAQEVRDHQPYWVALAHLRRRAGRPTEAAAALQRAIGLTADPRVREHLVRLHTAAT